MEFDEKRKSGSMLVSIQNIGNDYKRFVKPPGGGSKKRPPAAAGWGGLKQHIHEGAYGGNCGKCDERAKKEKHDNRRHHPPQSVYPKIRG